MTDESLEPVPIYEPGRLDRAAYYTKNAALLLAGAWLVIEGLRGEL